MRVGGGGRDIDKGGQEIYSACVKVFNNRASLKISVVALVVSLTLGLSGLIQAATTPDLGEAASFAILSSTYTNTVAGTTINGDLGYTTGPAFAPTVNGTVYSPPSTKYSQAGIDQGAALAALNSQACTHTFPAGAVDLATDTSHGPIGVYTPGVYCATAATAVSIGTAGITLSGSGTYIFRIAGGLTSVADSSVTLADGASACDVFWTPAEPTTLGANSTFAGINIDDMGITIGSAVTWTGSALAFGGTVSTDTDAISVGTCTTGLPDGGVGPEEKSISWNIIMLAGIFGLALISLGASLRKHTS